MDTPAPHQLRARMQGMLEWTCPWCGTFNRQRMNHLSWRVRCGGERCRRWFAHGHVFYSLQDERFSGRRERVPPDIAMPEAGLEPHYSYGQPVNRLELLDDSDARAEA